MAKVRENMQGIGVVEGDARNRVRWRKMLCFGNPKMEQLKKRMIFSTSVLSSVTEISIHVTVNGL